MLDVRFVDLEKSLFKSIFDDSCNKKTLFIFPTHTNRIAGQNYYQGIATKFENEFTVISELMEQVFWVDKPILKEENRTISLFLSLSNDSKDFFKINDYAQSIAFSNNFFSFFKELNDELVEESQIVQLLQENYAHLDWKLLNFEHLLKVKNDFEIYLKKKETTDEIFVKRIENLDTNFLKRFEQIVVVNQFYFTNLEKLMYKKFSKFADIKIFIQQPESIFDKNGLNNTSAIKANQLTHILQKKNINHFIANDSQDIILKAIQIGKDKEIQNFIDFKFEEQPYYNYLSEKRFVKNDNKSVIHTNIYKFFTHLESLLLGIKKIENSNLVPFQAFLDAILDSSFISFFQLKTSEYDNLKNFVFKLLEKDYKFFDLELSFYKVELLPKFFKQFVNFIKEIKEIEIYDLENLFFERKLLSLDRIFSNFEKQYFLEEFYQIFDDFLILQNSFKKRDWDKIFRAKSKFERSGLVIRFLLSYLKSRTYKVEANKRENKIKVSSLQNSRNTHYQSLIILNLNEKILPATRQIPYLLSDSERRELNLKTYEDIKARDKYYFYQLLCQTEAVYLFSIQNEDSDIEVSSFVEELLSLNLCNSESDISTEKKADEDKSSCDYLQSYLCNFEKRKIDYPKKDFFIIPFSKSDLDNNNLKLSPSSWSNLSDSPFEFYINNILHIRKKVISIEQDFSTSLIGTFAHNIINKMWDKYCKRFDYNLPADFYKKMQINVKLDNLLNKFRNSKDFLFKVPHNHSDIYFHEIFIPILRESIKSFFRGLANRTKLDNFEPIPEKKYLSKGEIIGKEICKIDDIIVTVSGKSDLRLETSQKKIIIDYKTGKSSWKKEKKYREQLKFYEFIYYLFEETKSDIKSAIYFIEEKKFTYPKNNFESNFRDEIKKVIEEIFEKGYFVSSKKASFEDEHITRRDLYDTLQ